MHVLVTGGAGFIGSHVVEALTHSGHSVVVLDDLSAGRRENLPPNLPVIVADIGSEMAATTVASGGFDVILHLAGQVNVRRSMEHPRRDAEVNVLGLINMFEATRRAPVPPRFIYPSTAGVYGDAAELPVAETAPAAPDSPYAVSKLAGEYYARYYREVWSMDVVTLRFANVYGPRQDARGEAGVVSIFCEQLKRGQAFSVFGDGRQTRDYVYVEDIAAACVRVAGAPRGDPMPPVFNIATGRQTSLLELIEVFRRVSGKSVEVDHLPARPGEIRFSSLSPALVRNHLGWSAETTLEDGLRRTVDWFR